MTAFHRRILALLTAFACFGVLAPVSAADYDKGAKVSESRDWGWKDRGLRKDWGWKRADWGSKDRGWRDHSRKDGKLFGWRHHDRKDWGWKRADWGWKDRGWRHHDRKDGKLFGWRHHERKDWGWRKHDRADGGKRPHREASAKD